MAEIYHYRDFKKPAELWSKMEPNPVTKAAFAELESGGGFLIDTAPSEYCADEKDPA